MFTNVSHNYNEKNDTWTFRANFGIGFKAYIENYVMGKKKSDQLFRSISFSEITIDSFFLLELSVLVRMILDGQTKYSSWVNHKSLKSLLDVILKETWLNPDEYNGLSKFELNIKRMNDYMAVSPMDFQMALYSKYEEVKNILGYNGMLADAATGVGKCLSLDSLIRIPNGWKEMRDIKVGDEVISKDGSKTIVTAVYPQEKLKDMYRITFEDGRSVKCTEDHLWKVYHPKYVRSSHPDCHDGSKVITTEELIKFKSYGSSDSRRYYIDLPDSEQNEDKKYFIDPYILGCILGDGSISGKTIGLTISSPSVIERMMLKLKPGYKIIRYPSRKDYEYSLTVDRDSETYKSKTNLFKQNNEYTLALRALDLMGKTALDKFIPKRYLNGSTAQRLELLRGLMDTDGCVGKNGDLSYSTSSLQLAKDIQYLIRSLGGLAKIKSKIPFYTHNGERKQGNVNYIIGIRMKNPLSIVTRPEKRAERLKETNQYSNGLKLRIAKIEYLGKEEAQCISVDHPSRLYVTNDYIVTHNTYMGLSISEAIESDFVVMITMKANMETVWLDTLINSNKKEYFFKKPISREEVYLSTDAYKNKVYSGQKYILFNYEAIDKLLMVLPYIRHKKTTILVDEAHNFTSLNSNRKNNLVRFCKESNSKDILLLSGTPIKATSLDMMPYLELIDPKFNPVVAARFKKLYSSPNHILKTCVPIRYGTMSVKIEKEVLNLAPIEYSTVVVNLKDGDKYTLSNIKTEMQNYITFRIKELEDNILHFKDMYNKLLDKAKASLNISAKAWIDYENNFKLVNDYYQKRQLMFHADLIKNVNEFEKAIILPVLKGEEKQNFREAAVVLKYPMLKVRGEVLGKVVLGARIECHKEMAKVLNYEILNSTSAKSIIMSSYIDVCEAAYDATKKAGFNPVKVYGDETKNQTANISKFIEDEKSDPAIGTYKSISTGHHLVVADLVLLMDVPFRTYVLDQAIARVYRMGQKNIVHILYTKLDTGEDYNINSRNIDILKWAKDAVEEITGNTIKGLDFDKGKEIANDIAAGLENDVKGDWEHTQSAVLLSSNFMDWLAGLEDNNNAMEIEDIKEDSGLLSDRCIPKEKSHINW